MRVTALYGAMKALFVLHIPDGSLYLPVAVGISPADSQRPASSGVQFQPST
jgi:hypothetical protein